MIPALHTQPLHSLLLASVVLMGCSTTAVDQPVASSSKISVPEMTPVESTAAPAVGQPTEDQLRYTVRKTFTPPAPPAPPRVLLSAGHAKLCRVNVGDPFPAVRLPLLGGPTTQLATLRGKQATVILFWHPDRWMARTALIDMQRDIASQFAAEQVAVVGIAVELPAGAVQSSLNQAKAAFPQLIDTDGAAFAAVGTVALPRLYVLDPTGKIIWFDIEYSEGTRRELWQTLKVLASDAGR